MGWAGLRVGSGPMGHAATGKSGLGSRSLGAREPRLLFRGRSPAAVGVVWTFRSAESGGPEGPHYYLALGLQFPA